MQKKTLLLETRYSCVERLIHRCNCGIKRELLGYSKRQSKAIRKKEKKEGREEKGKKRLTRGDHCTGLIIGTIVRDGASKSFPSTLGRRNGNRPIPLAIVLGSQALTQPTAHAPGERCKGRGFLPHIQINLRLDGTTLGNGGVATAGFAAR